MKVNATLIIEEIPLLNQRLETTGINVQWTTIIYLFDSSKKTEYKKKAPRKMSGYSLLKLH